MRILNLPYISTQGTPNPLKPKKSLEAAALGFGDVAGALDLDLFRDTLGTCWRLRRGSMGGVGQSHSESLPAGRCDFRRPTQHMQCLFRYVHICIIYTHIYT